MSKKFFDSSVKNNLKCWLLLMTLFVVTSLVAQNLTDKSQNKKLITLKNEFLTLGILPDLGAHIVLLKYKDSPNILLSNEKLWSMEPPSLSAEKPEFFEINGHITWLSPQKEWWAQQDINIERRDQKWNWPPDPFLTLSKYQILNLKDDVIELKGSESPVSKITLNLKIALVQDSVQLSVLATNTSDTTVSWGLWSNTRLPGTAAFYLPVKPDKIKHLRSEMNSWSPVSDRILPFTFENNFLTFDTREAEKNTDLSFVNKIFIQAETKTLAAFTENFLFLKTIKTDCTAVHSAQKALEVFLFYGNKESSKLELEAHSDYKKLAPQARIQLDEEWKIIPYSGENTPSSQTEFLKQLIDKKS